MNFEHQQYYNCTITVQDGTQYRIDAMWAHNNNLDNWQGWNCDAGHNRIYIDADKNVYSSLCENDYLGNLKTQWHLLQKPTICQQTRCTGCMDDLLARKQHVV